MTRPAAKAPTTRVARTWPRSGSTLTSANTAPCAGVGIGTLYRHFPTREALYEAVYRREVEQPVELADQLTSEPSPVDALRRWLHSNIEFVATKKGMSAALALAVQGSPELRAYTLEQLTTAVAALLERAVTAGEIRPGISADDVLRALVGMCYMHDQPGWQASVARLVDVFVDGLCVQAKVNRQSRPVSQRSGGGASVRQTSPRRGSRKSRG
jgi:AcrR family transcriptional regulator